MRQFTNRQKHDAAVREAGYRRRVYARLVREGKMKQAAADEGIEVMEAIAKDYAPQADLFGCDR